MKIAFGSIACSTHMQPRTDTYTEALTEQVSWGLSQYVAHRYKAQRCPSVSFAVDNLTVSHQKHLQHCHIICLPSMSLFKPQLKNQVINRKYVDQKLLVQTLQDRF